MWAKKKKKQPKAGGRAKAEPVEMSVNNLNANRVRCSLNRTFQAKRHTDTHTHVPLFDYYPFFRFALHISKPLFQLVRHVCAFSAAAATAATATVRAP